mmetsp:Transcript_34774/g.98588  ORF Transcript_34774/g.98588 Transcript_34774/m.98588 type:complete len:221 (+) Transcript_34774:387-1049(+)|eukprot:CAMPEP_0117651984 /NCGR_PEP_ID=MMETSP0804-20121206/2385_1 /TAXON_ID=1074897 /ORGANISM="Tetraselmis astigmatica, Strain CCMP880" /LENGTH=220 /DNA_ID=CAMNT_0005458001 /DNA_START=288 /DNA_END=950 /DNA_ORIENTATION=+
MQERRLRVLALHGWRTSARFLEWQLTKYSRLANKLEDQLEVTYLDAPHPASGPIPDGISNFVSGPYFEWWNATKKSNDQNVYEGMEESVSFVLDYMRLHGPFDGLLGFSQGGTMCGIILALCQSGAAELPFPPPAFCLNFSGLLSRDYRHLQLYDTPISTPTVLVWGEKDHGNRYTKKLSSCFVDPIEISHPGGHVIPALGSSEVQQIRSFLTAILHSKL